MSAISSSLAELRKRKIELERELNRINRAVLVLSELNNPEKTVKSVHRKQTLCVCIVCKKKFMAGRKDAQYCKNPCMPQKVKAAVATPKEETKKVVATLLKGDNLSQKDIR